MSASEDQSSHRGEVASDDRPSDTKKPFKTLDSMFKFPKNVDLPGNAYNLNTQYQIPARCMDRPKEMNNSGQAGVVALNSYAVTSIPSRTIHQYDINIGKGDEKRGLITVVWNSKTMKEKIGTNGWIFNGDKIAWFHKKLDAMTFTVDLDQEKGIAPRAGRSNAFRVQVRQTKELNLHAIEAYLAGTLEFDNTVLESVTFLDHLMRETPSKIMIAIKRSFFHQKITARASIGGGVEAMKGIYQSIRVAQGGKMVVNVDVSNSTFWGNWSMHAVVPAAAGTVPLETIHRIQKVQKKDGSPFMDSKAMVQLRRLKKVMFQVKYRNISEEQMGKKFIVRDFKYTDSRETKFEWTNRDTKVTKLISLYDYFKEKYNQILLYPTLPVVETTKKGVMFPPEVCFVCPGQKFNFKLDELQTSNMIKFAVTRPNVRKEAIEGGLKLLDWAGDKYMSNYGLKISPDMIQTNCRVLAPPGVQFGANKVERPGYAGRWRLDGKQFLLANAKPLKSWGVCVMNHGREKLQQGEVQNFLRQFMTIYKSHGGKIENSQPEIMMGEQDESKAVAAIFNKTGVKCNMEPQLLLFMLSGKDSFVYNRIKKSADCRFGVMSQCMQNAHVKRAQSQYISNLLMKVNAKLGGVTARVQGKTPMGHFKVNTMLIGADVSHASPGSLQASMAAVTVSMDLMGCRYAAACETNGHRVEMISTWNMEEMLTPLFREWQATIGGGRFPEHIMFFRDGVSEGQYQHVLAQEIRDLKHIWHVLDNGTKGDNARKIKYTVVVASKRHHIRFFPKAGSVACDKNGNPNPGVLVERDVTHPFEYDFYLNSHSAIQGTARPTHYHVLMDDSNMSPTTLQNIIYEQCYQYMRSTTPVSLFPAVYYAHLASNRAKSHETLSANEPQHKNSDERERAELLKHKAVMDATGKQLSKSSLDKLRIWTRTEYPQLITMENKGKIRWGMWYI